MTVVGELGTLLVITALISSSWAQDGGLFNWGFASDDPPTTSIPACSPIPIIIYPLDSSTNPTPPFYMISFALESKPVTSFIGTDPNNLTWTSTQPVGSRLSLSVVDASGNPGGLAPQIYDVNADQTTECVVPLPTTPDFTVTANVTTPANLSTCQPWGLTMQGGQPPYSITVVQPDSLDFTNATLPPKFNSFTYINRANPGGQLIAAVSDSTSRWAVGTPIVDTIGSTDISCGNLVSSGGIQSVAVSRKKAQEKRRNLIVGVSVPLILLTLVALGGTGYHIWRRKRRAPRYPVKTWPPAIIEPRPTSMDEDFDPATLYSPSLDSGGLPAQAYSYTRLAHHAHPSLTSLSYSTPTVALTYHHELGDSWVIISPELDNGNASMSQEQSRTPSKSQINSPASLTRPSAKSPTGGLMASRSIRNSEGRATSSAAGRPSLPVVNANEGQDAVFQHRDGGHLSIEIPPPYPNHSSEHSHNS